MDYHKEENENKHLTEAERYREAAKMHEQEMKSAWKTFGKTGLFVLAAAVVFVLICVSWFVQNSQVKGNSGTVRADQNIVRIASKGDRQTAELHSTLGLQDGSVLNYNDEDYYYTENDEIAMRLSDDYKVAPGVSGFIEFYVIPTRSGARTVTLELCLAGYQDGEDDQVVPVEDEALNELLKGHVLLFESYQDGFYSDWLYNSDAEGIYHNTITVSLPENAAVDVPYPYRIYWIWPKRYENMISHRQNKKDLYAEDSGEFIHTFMPFVETQSSGENKSPIGSTGYSYSSVFLSDEWPLSDKNVRSKAYNLADEYIGTNADYLYLTIRIAS